MTVSTSALQQRSDGTISERVLATIANQSGVDPLDFDRRLYDVIDPDALDALFQSSGADGRVTFTYLGYEVTVRSDGALELNRVDG